MRIHRIFSTVLFLLVFMTTVFWGVTQTGHAQSDEGWSEPVNLSLSGIAANPVVVIDRENVFHAIWVDEVDGYKYSRSLDGIDWIPPRTVQFPFEAKDQKPVILADEFGAIHFFWINSLRELNYGQTLPGNFDQPNDWKVRVRLAVDVIGFNAVLDTRGFLHVAYVVAGGTGEFPAGVYYRQSNIGGAAWPDVKQLYVSEYFRAATLDDAYVRLSVSDSRSEQNVFVTWDNRAQKRVFMAVSRDSGRTWGGAQEVKGPSDTGGIDTPFNLTVSSFDDNVLLIWQVGEPGSSKCTVFSQWSQDGGVSWGDAIPVLGGRSECPVGVNVVAKDAQYTSVIFEGQVNPIMVAWNGVEWSDPQAETQIPSIINPLTYDAILLGCRYDLIHNGRLYVAGCDQGRGGDVWFLSRPLLPVETWFSPSFLWRDPDVLSIRSEAPRRILHFATARDLAGNVHAVWVQSPAAEASVADLTIEYARWDGNRWSAPESVMNSLTGMPLQVSAYLDPLGRLLVTWVDGFYGDLLFSWANSESANLGSEWQDVNGLPVVSRLTSESDTVVDGSGRIVNVSVVPVNENRGIYMTQSTDGGKNWSAPLRVFDAVAEGWERVEKPRISLGKNGVLHLVFVKDTVRIGQPVGMYYLQSTDGGLTWSTPQLLSEGDVQWLDVVSYGENTVHVIWQEFDGLVYANVSQVSGDGGATWGKQYNVTGVNNAPSSVALASDGRGLLHFIQLVGNDSNDTLKQKGLILQDYQWDGANWIPQLSRDVIIKGQDVVYALSAEITSSGRLGVFIPVEYKNADEKLISEVLTFSRILEYNPDLELPQAPILPAAVVVSEQGEVVVVQPTPTPDYSILYDDNIATTPLQENIAGLAIIGVGVIATLVLLLWRKPEKK